jgi:hypothetical protein
MDSCESNLFSMALAAHRARSRWADGRASHLEPALAIARKRKAAEAGVAEESRT